MKLDFLKDNRLSEKEKVIVTILTGSVFVGLSLFLSAALLSITYLWGCIGFICSVVSVIFICLIAALCANDE